jgi:hypothetical protein
MSFEFQLSTGPTVPLKTQEPTSPFEIALAEHDKRDRLLRDIAKKTALRDLYTKVVSVQLCTADYPLHVATNGPKPENRQVKLTNNYPALHYDFENDDDFTNRQQHYEQKFLAEFIDKMLIALGDEIDAAKAEFADIYGTHDDQ